MRVLLSFSVFLSLATPALAAERKFRFSGTWETPRSSRLDGPMSAVVTEKGPELWEGFFYGVWGGAKFDYTVKFSGKARTEKGLKGTAVIDDIAYTWTGTMDIDRLEGTFDGIRHDGTFYLKRDAKELKAALETLEKEKAENQKKASQKNDYVWHEGFWWALSPDQRWYYWRDNAWVPSK